MRRRWQKEVSLSCAKNSVCQFLIGQQTATMQRSQAKEFPTTNQVCPSTNCRQPWRPSLNTWSACKLLEMVSSAGTDTAPSARVRDRCGWLCVARCPAARWGISSGAFPEAVLVSVCLHDSRHGARPACENYERPHEWAGFRNARSQAPYSRKSGSHLNTGPRSLL